MRFLVGLGFLVPNLAFAAGGGGVSLSGEGIGTLGRGGVDAGTLACFGGLGFSSEEQRRIGGEGRYCGNGRASLAEGGAVAGRQFDLPLNTYGIVQIAGGAGFLKAADINGSFNAAYLYGRPSIGVGLPVLGLGAVEASWFLDVPVPLVQRLSDTDLRPVVSFPTTGLQVSFLFGDVDGDRDERKHRRRDEEVAPAEEAAAPSPAPVEVARVEAPPAPTGVSVEVRASVTPPPGAIDVEGEGTRDSRPLAIPASR